VEHLIRLALEQRLDLVERALLGDAGDSMIAQPSACFVISAVAPISGTMLPTAAQ